MGILVTIVVLGMLAFFGLIAFFSSFYIVGQQEASVLERFGKFLRTSGPGLHFKVPFIDNVVANVSLKIQQLDVKVQSKTKDNVFVILSIAVQYFVKENSVFEAHYKLADATRQIESYIYDVVRAKVPTMDLTEVYENKDDIAQAVNQELNTTMNQYGFEISRSLVNDIAPEDQRVTKALNAVVASQREREAAIAKAEGEKQSIILRAEAHRDEKELQGQGIALQRKAIADGLKEQVETIREGTKDVSDDQIMTILMLTQNMDTLREMASNGRSTIIFMDHSPGGMTNLSDQMQRALLSSQAALDHTPTAETSERAKEVHHETRRDEQAA